MWVCEKCNEELEDNFDTCWKCQNPKIKPEVVEITDERKEEIKKSNDEYIKQLMDSMGLMGLERSNFLRLLGKDSESEEDSSNDGKWIKKWLIRVSHMTLSNGYRTEWFDFKECEVYECEDGDIEDGDMLDDGSMYKGKVVNYTEFLEVIEKEGLEVIDTSEEDYHILNSLEEGKEKFNELIKNTWVEN